VCLAGFVLLAVYFLRTSKYGSDLEYSFQSVDALLKTGKYDEAGSLLRSLRPPATAGGWLRLLKRCRSLAAYTNDAAFFAEKALAAEKAHPKNEEMAAIAVLALADAGRDPEALSLAREKVLSLEYRSVRAEAFLRAGSPAGPEEEADGEMLFTILPESRRYEDFIKAAEFSGEEDFYFDAALLLMEAGENRRAEELFSRPGVGQKYPYPASLAFYDGQKYAESDSHWELIASSFKMRPQALALRADSFMRQRRWKESENYHDILLAQVPQYSVVPYLASNFFRHMKKPWSGESFLRNSLSVFPNNYFLGLDLAKLLTATGRVEEGRAAGEKIYSHFLERGSPPEADEFLAAADSRVLLLVLQRESIPLGRFVASLWMLHDEYSASAEAPSISRLLRWHLLSLSDAPALTTLLNQAEEDSFSLCYAAALLVSEKKLPDARETLVRQTKKFPQCPEGFYNLGLVEQALGLGESALASFRAAEALSEYAQTTGFAESAFLKTVDALIRLKRLPEAHGLLRGFLEKNPGHADALRFLNGVTSE
jgi:hypothetical protein